MAREEREAINSVCEALGGIAAELQRLGEALEAQKPDKDARAWGREAIAADRIQLAKFFEAERVRCLQRATEAHVRRSYHSRDTWEARASQADAYASAMRTHPWPLAWRAGK